MRLIDADVFNRKLEDEFHGMISDEGLKIYKIIQRIDETPTIDAVPVVRCKDCKYYRNHPNGMCYAHTEPHENAKGYKGEAVCIEPDDFCSYGEKKGLDI